MVKGQRRAGFIFLYVTTANDAACGFNRGLMSVEAILAALQPR